MKRDKINNIFILLGLLFFSVAYIYISKKESEIEEKGIKTVGLIYYTGKNIQYGNRYCKYVYYINGSKYKGIKSYYESEYLVNEEEYYEILYNPEELDNSDIILKNKIHPDSVSSYFDGLCPFKY